MIDDFNRKIDYIRISVTDRCNLRCVYCMPQKGVDFISHENILTYEEIIRLCECFAKLGISKVKLTGGEPLVRKDISLLIRKIKNIQGIEKVTITTNGIQLADKIEELYKAGIDGINISLDTLNSEYFKKLTRFDGLDKVKEGICEVLKYKDITVKINAVPLKREGAKEDILAMVSLAKAQPLHIRFIEVMPIGLGKNLTSYNEEEIIKLITNTYGTLTPYMDVLGNGPSHYYSLEGYKGKIGFISAISHQFCSSCNRIRLTSDGYLKNCLHYANGVDLKTMMRQGIDDGALVDEICNAIKRKPKEHHFKDYMEMNELESTLERRSMSQIGG